MEKLAFVWALAKALLTLRQRPRGWSRGYTLYVRTLRGAFGRIWRKDYAAQRRISSGLAKPSRASKAVRIEKTPHGEWLIPAQTRVRGAYLYFHGGGFNGAYTQAHRNFCAAQALAIGGRVFAATYRLAPEHRYPAQLDDAEAALSWLRTQTDGPIVVGGDSAGANLALALQQRQRTHAIIALCPWLDLTCAMPVSEDWIRPRDWYAWTTAFLGGQDARLASPMFADLRGIGPLLVQVGTAEGLHAQSVRFAAKAQSDGVRVTLAEYPRMVHDWHMLGLPDSKRALAEIAAFYHQVVQP